jgi:hypothetical protein
MGDTIPEWALTRAREVIATRRKYESMALAFARALAAVEVETAERVEAETREADAGVVEGVLMDAGQRFLSRRVARSLRSFPAKYGKATV